MSTIDWNVISKKTFISGSYAGDVKLWDPFFGAPVSAATFTEHAASIYTVKWSPHFDKTFISCGGDGFVKVWDISKGPISALTIRASHGEVLSCDWNKYNNFQFATSGATSDPVIKIWDLRNTSKPVMNFNGHRFGIRKVIFSPHDQNLLVSTG